MENKLTIEQCVSQILEIMRRRNYNEGTIEHYTHHYNQFLKYCKKHNYEYFSDQISLEFLAEHYGICLQSLEAGSPLNGSMLCQLRPQRILSVYSASQVFVTKFSRFHSTITDDYWKPIYQGFLQEQKERGIRESTIRHRELTIRIIIEYFIAHGIYNCNSITQSAVEEILALFINEAPKSVAARCGEMRFFFLYCFSNGYSSEDKSRLVRKVAAPHRTNLPINWKIEDVKRILNSVDRDSPAGKRDYAILMLACKYGLRSVDIRNLELEDINWEAKEIIIKQQKTSNTIHLPLLTDIGWALIDYIRHGRPATTDNAVFITATAPYRRLSGSAGLNTIFKKYLNLSGVSVPREGFCGMHTLRHTLGRVLLEKQVPLPQISQILGHQSIKSTSIYLQIDMNGLKACMINPDEVSI
jgi:site-specific recombinase XerD